MTFAISQVQNGDEAHYHFSGNDEDLKHMFWIKVSEPLDLFQRATDFMLDEPDPTGLEPTRYSTRFDTFIADEIEQLVRSSEVVEWLLERRIPFELDTGYWQLPHCRALLIIHGDIQNSMLFKLTFA